MPLRPPGPAGPSTRARQPTPSASSLLFPAQPLPLLVILILCLAWNGPARAESSSITYQLKAGGEVIGSREFEIRFLPGRTSEVRLIQAWTNFKFTLGPTTYSFRQRLGGRLGGSRSFSSYIDDNGMVREVQGQVSPSGTWMVTVVQGGRARTWHMEPGSVDLNSLELLDPDRALLTLQQLDYLRILATETGGIIEGPLTDLGTATLHVGGQAVQVQRFRWAPPAGDMILSYSQEGYLVSYDVTIAGHLLTATMNNLPPPRSYSDMQQPILGEVVTEEPL